MTFLPHTPITKDCSWNQSRNNFLVSIKREKQLQDAILNAVELQERSLEATKHSFQLVFCKAGWPENYIPIWSTPTLYPASKRNISTSRSASSFMSENSHHLDCLSGVTNRDRALIQHDEPSSLFHGRTTHRHLPKHIFPQGVS